MTRRINTLLWIGLTFTLIIGSSFIVDVYRAFYGDHGIWWTPNSMRLPLEETKDVFDLYIGGKPLRMRLSDKTLFSVDKNGKQYPVVSRDITVRLNNWDKTKASILTHTTLSGPALGAALTLLVIGLIQFFHPERKPLQSE